MKKLISLLCALALMAAILPCTVAAADDEPIVITYYREELNRNSVASYMETAWVKELESRLNIKLEIQGPASSDDYNTAVNAMLTSRKYPDLLYFDWNTQYNGGMMAGVEDGVIVPISEIPEYKEKVPNWFKVLDEHPEVRRSVVNDDGSIVSFCHWEPNMARSAYWGYAVRKDWLDRLNLEVPKTIDDLYNVLVAFRDNDANGNGDPSDELPFSCCNWWGTAHPGMDSLAAAFSLAQDLPEDAILVVSETEYTGAGKHIQPQLWFAKQNGIDVRLGDPKEEVPGKSVVLPASPALFQYKEADIDHFRQSLIKKAVKKAGVKPSESDLEFLAEETKTDVAFVTKTLEENGLL